MLKKGIPCLLMLFILFSPVLGVCEQAVHMNPNVPKQTYDASSARAVYPSAIIAHEAFLGFSFVSSDKPFLCKIGYSDSWKSIHSTKQNMPFSMIRITFDDRRSPIHFDAIRAFHETHANVYNKKQTLFTRTHNRKKEIKKAPLVSKHDLTALNQLPPSSSFSAQQRLLAFCSSQNANDVLLRSALALSPRNYPASSVSASALPSVPPLPPVETLSPEIPQPDLSVDAPAVTPLTGDPGLTITVWITIAVVAFLILLFSIRRR